MGQLVNSTKLCLWLLVFLGPFSSIQLSYANSFPEETCDHKIKILSDFDDTIKTYPSKKMAVMGFYALFKRHINVGFDRLYKEIIGGSGHYFCKKKPALKVVSASPSFLHSRVESLLNHYQFPASEIFLRPLSKKSRAFKMEVIEGILEKEKGPFIFIGDDINEDHVIYHELKKKFPEKIEEVYIHNVDNKKSFSGQKKYWTAFDLGLMELQKGRVSYRALKKIGEDIMQASPWKVIPPYGHCPPSGFLKNTFIQDKNLLNLAQRIDLRVQEICRSR